MSQARQQRSALAAAMREFCTHIKQLAADLEKRFPHDERMRRLKRQVVIGANDLPEHVVCEAGSQLSSYSDAIYSPDPAVWRRFFYDPNAFDRDLGASVDLKKRDDAEYLIPRLQRLAQTLGEDEQLGYLEKLRQMLDVYADYLDARAALGL